jgi:hypothetical protein
MVPEGFTAAGMARDRRGCMTPAIAWASRIRTLLWPTASVEASARPPADLNHDPDLNRARASRRTPALPPVDLMASRDPVGGPSAASEPLEERLVHRNSAARVDSLRPLTEREVGDGIRPR